MRRTLAIIRQRPGDVLVGFLAAIAWLAVCVGFLAALPDAIPPGYGGAP